MNTGIIHSLIDVLKRAFQNLQLTVPEAEIEDLATTVHMAMSVEGRHYHTSDHAILLSDPHDPIQTLAALFHDIVYYQVDRGFSSEVMDIIQPNISFDPSVSPDLFLRWTARSEHTCYRIAMDIFGFSPGQKQNSITGLNEFLSALVMGKKLDNLVPEKVLLQCIVYIEATIPFRAKDPDGRGPFDLLEQRLRRVSQAYHIPLSESEIEDTLRGAVLFANKDVENFSETEPAVFLENTWKLLPETNLALRSGEFYSVRDYRLALMKTDNYLSLLAPENIFHTYKGAPPAGEYWEKIRNARHNLQTARLYLSIKLLTIAILEALAEVTGGDAPLSIFMGDVCQDNPGSPRLEDFLPSVPVHPEIDPDSVVYSLLMTGRVGQAEFTDLLNSPLSLFVYCSLGQTRVAEDLIHARLMFDGALMPDQFLQKIDHTLLSAIAGACAQMVPTRSDQLMRFTYPTPNFDR